MKSAHYANFPIPASDISKAWASATLSLRINLAYIYLRVAVTPRLTYTICWVCIGCFTLRWERRGNGPPRSRNTQASRGCSYPVFIPRAFVDGAYTSVEGWIREEIYGPGTPALRMIVVHVGSFPSLPGLHRGKRSRRGGQRSLMRGWVDK